MGLVNLLRGCIPVDPLLTMYSNKQGWLAYRLPFLNLFTMATSAYQHTPFLCGSSHTCCVYYHDIITICYSWPISRLGILKQYSAYIGSYADLHFCIREKQGQLQRSAA